MKNRKIKKMYFSSIIAVFVGEDIINALQHLNDVCMRLQKLCSIQTFCRYCAVFDIQ